MKRTIVMMAKAPEAGRAKTRLAASIGDEAAVALAQSFIEDLSFLLSQVDADVVLAWAGDEAHPAFDTAREHGFRLTQQRGSDLGERLRNVMDRESERADEVFIIGSDSPTLTTRHFHDAFAALERADVVIGPSFDGGYYLVGSRSQWYRTHDGATALFSNIAWSTEDVLGQTLRQIRSVGALCELTSFCYDVDTVDDLKLLRAHLLDYLRPSGLDVGEKTAILLSGISTD